MIVSSTCSRSEIDTKNNHKESRVFRRNQFSDLFNLSSISIYKLNDKNDMTALKKNRPLVTKNVKIIPSLYSLYTFIMCWTLLFQSLYCYFKNNLTKHICKNNVHWNRTK